jgi:hypothetical protein
MNRPAHDVVAETHEPTAPVVLRMQNRQCQCRSCRGGWLRLTLPEDCGILFLIFALPKERGFGRAKDTSGQETCPDVDSIRIPWVAYS